MNDMNLTANLEEKLNFSKIDEVLQKNDIHNRQKIIARYKYILISQHLPLPQRKTPAIRGARNPKSAHKRLGRETWESACFSPRLHPRMDFAMLKCPCRRQAKVSRKHV
jgi:hypothetical protein